MKQIEWNESLFAWGRRCTAVGFIILILLGNLWASLRLTGAQIPAWLFDGGVGAVGLVALGGFMLLVSYLARVLNL